ncbi:MAG: aldo/keto reductase [Bryobacteraceae bacterium]|nr:aldo/keto reductase [Bryobacteraceae bacterium]
MDPAAPRHVELGLGLISLGRKWATRETPLGDDEAVRLLGAAVALGIGFFDTAPSYASSEQKLGRFLRGLPPERLAPLTIATKCGEDWIEQDQAPRADHSYDALCASIDRSLARLPAAHLLQIHKATARVLEAPDVLRALAYARSRGFQSFGASVKDLDAARAACANPVFSYLQFPFSVRNRDLEPIFELAADSERKLIVNRPLAMGAVFTSPDRAPDAARHAFGFILQRPFSGVLLMGTGSVAHLEKNVAAFQAAQQP